MGEGEVVSDGRDQHLDTDTEVLKQYIIVIIFLKFKFDYFI